MSENLGKEKNYNYVETIDEEITAERKEEKLLRIIGNVDEEYIKEATPRIRGKVFIFRMASMVACLLAVVLGGVWVSNVVRDNVTEDGAVKVVEPSKFETIDELLEHLEISKEDKGSGGDRLYTPGIIKQNNENDPEAVETYQGYIYRVCNEKLQIISEKDIQGEGYTLEGNVNDVAIVKDKLIVLDGYIIEDGSEKLKKNATYKVYDLTTPYEPKLINTYVFNVSGAYMYIDKDDEVIFEMRDGACECGFGNGYYAPEIIIDDEKITWSDKEISILGNPSVIQYAAFMRVNIDTAEIEEKQVFYGIIERTYMKNEYLVIHTKTTDGVEEMYLYEKSDLSTALVGFDIAGTAKKNGDCKDFSIKEIKIEDNILYGVGTSEGENDNDATQISAMIWDIKSNQLIWKNESIGKNIRIHSVIWNEKKAICNMDNANASRVAKVYVEFCDDEIKITKGEMVANDGQTYYGYYTLNETLYARWNSKEDDVIAIFKCLESGGIENVYQTRIEDVVKVEITDIIVLDNNIVGIVTNKDEVTTNDEYNNVVELRLYKLVTDGGVSLEFLNNCEIRKGDRTYREKYEIYEKEGTQYLIFDRSEELIPVSMKN